MNGEREDNTRETGKDKNKEVKAAQVSRGVRQNTAKMAGIRQVSG